MADTLNSGTIFLTGSFPFVGEYGGWFPIDAAYEECYEEGVVVCYERIAPIIRFLNPGNESILRQGIEMRGGKDRYQDIQPKMWAGFDGRNKFPHEHPQLTFGIERLWSPFTSFIDNRFDIDINLVIDHFRSGTVSITERFAEAGDDDGDIELFNGVVEPLEIRTVKPRASGSTNPVRGHGVAAELGEGSRGDPVEQFFRLGVVDIPEPFNDAGTATLASSASFLSDFGRSSGTLVSRAELLSPRFIKRDSTKLISLAKEVRSEQSSSFTPREIEFANSLSQFAFDDSQVYVRGVTQNFITAQNRHLFEGVASGTAGETDPSIVNPKINSDSFIAARRRSATAGFTYHSTPFGTDSIAFGGLLRYKVQS